MSQLFETLGIDEDFNPFFAEHGIKKPNEVQNKVIPKLLENKSIICLAQTGSGKTLSYALPISELIKCIEDEKGLGQEASKPYAVILAPTKELATQIQQVFKDISHHVKLRVRVLLGGQKVKSLKTQSYEILVATPNRLVKALRDKEVSFDNLKYLIFDEADQIFDIGFKKDVENLLRPVEFSQTEISFFSATLPFEVEEFIQENFKKKELQKITVGDAHTVQAGKVDTFNIFLSPKEKLAMLKGFFEKTAKGRGIVFVNQRNQIEEVAEFLQKEVPKLKFKILHGELTQKERMENHKNFVEKKSQVLVASDIAARGIDIKDLEWILNFGLPKTAVYYLHRCGRVGRAGKKGIVYNFVTNFDSKLIGHINDAIKKQSQLDLDFIAKDIKEVRRKKSLNRKIKRKK